MNALSQKVQEIRDNLQDLGRLSVINTRLKSKSLGEVIDQLQKEYRRELMSELPKPFDRELQLARAGNISAAILEYRVRNAGISEPDAAYIIQTALTET